MFFSNKGVHAVVGLRTEHKQRFLIVAAVISVALMLLWPAILNGEPFYMPDTPSYIRGADGAIHELTGTTSAWSDEFQKRFADPSATAKALEASKISGEVHSKAAVGEPAVVLKGRSIYYGALLYAAQWPGNFWAMAVFQSLLCSIAVLLTTAAVRGALGRKTRPINVVAAGVALAALTPIGYFATYLLPDVFGALGLLAVGHLLFFWDQEPRLARFFWFALLACATLFHTANILLVSLLALATGIGLLFRLPASKSGFAAIVATLAIGFLGQMIFAWGVKHATGAAPVRPPFLAARIIDDGVGYDYLREHCPGVRLIYCRTLGFRTRDSNSLLWSADPREGIFQALPPAEQRLAAAQQNVFVTAVIRERPLELAASSIRSFFRQLGYFKLESFNYTAHNNYYFRNKLPQPFLEHAKQSRAYQQKMPVKFVEWATLASVLASLAGVALAIRAMIRREKKLTPVAGFLLMLVLGVLLNAAICGAFSTPRGRYQMRLIWVLPLAAMATYRVRAGRKDVSDIVASGSSGAAVTN